ncbi:MAG TPA: GerAB/ArcD/ProY family transporter [Firmicutes bacterium]|nr:GerAB/ArcD/ProY family transporter [Bacillota bacterium]
MHKGKVSDWQVFLLVFITTISTPVFTQPSKAYWILEYGGWQLILVGLIVATAGILISSLLARRFPGETYARYSRSSMGGVLGFIFTLLLAIWYLVAGAHDSFLMARAVRLALLYETPVLAIFLGGALSVAYLAWGGLERLSRFTEAVTLVLIPLLVFMLTAPLQHAEFRNLLPVFRFPARQYVTLKFWFAAYMFRGFALLYMVQPYMANPHRGGIIAFWATVAAAAFFAPTFAYPVMVFGMPVAKLILWPFWIVIRITRFSGFPVEKLLYFATVAWHIMATVSTTVFLYLSSVAMAELAGLKHHRHMMFALLLPWTFMSMFPRSYMEFHTFDDIYVALGWITTIVLPLITLLAAHLRGGSVKAKNKGKVGG